MKGGHKKINEKLLKFYNIKIIKKIKNISLM